LKDIYKNQKTNMHEKDKQRAIGKYGMVASAADEATKAGAKILEEGGNAMDALVAVQFALSVVEIFNTGIGASGFIVYYDQAKKEAKVINGHAQAPKGVTQDMFRDTEGNFMPFYERTMHASAVAIPGIMKAMDVALKNFGTLPLDKLIEPAVQLAENGHRVDCHWGESIETLPLRMGEEAKAFFIPNGIPRVEGEWVCNENLAKTLRIIQKEGIEAIYEGEIADAIIDTLQTQGGVMTKSDLSGYRAKIETPVTGKYKEYELIAPGPPNAGGISLIQLLNILEGFDLSQYSPSSWEKYYLLVEAMRLTFSDKLAYMGDPAFAEIPLKGLLHPEYIKERQKFINWSFSNPEIDSGNPWEYQGSTEPKAEVKAYRIGEETTHFTAVDRWGNVAACTSSNEHYFGSGIMVPEYGFLLNNDLTDFDPEPNHINSMEPGKFSVSTKTPTIVFKEGKPILTLGSPGGPTIVASVAQVLINILDFHMDIKDAIEEPKIYNSVSPHIWWEEGIDEKVINKMEAMGFEFLQPPKTIGNVQAILLDHDNRLLFGAADSSRPGSAIGVQNIRSGK
jgi:gamma-glutamyltranspeptidase / glutathione hydrolase